MKKNLCLPAAAKKCAGFIMLLLLSGNSTKAQNTAPSASFGAPVSNTTFLSGSTVTAWINASDPNSGTTAPGTIQRVDFTITPPSGSAINYSDYTAPYNYDITSVATGTYNLTAKAYDNTGLVSATQTKTFIVIAAGTVSSNTYYVDGNISSSGAGTTLATAKKTIQEAVNLALPGDIIYVKQATNPYTNATAGGTVVTFNRTGSNGHPITLTALSGNIPKIKFDGWNGILIPPGPSYLEISGFEIEGNNQSFGVNADGTPTAAAITTAQGQPAACDGSGGFIAGSPDPIYNGNGISANSRYGGKAHSHHITIKNNTIHDCGGGGIGILECDYVTIQRNEVYNNAWYSLYACSGISFFHAWNSDGLTGTKNLIQNNKVSGNRMYVKWVSGCAITDGNGIIIDDLLNTQASSSIQGTAYAAKTAVLNNFVFGNGGAGIADFSSINVIIANNTAYHNSQSTETHGEVYASYSSNAAIFNNIIIPITGEVAQNSPDHNTAGTVTYDYNLYLTGTTGTFGTHDIFTADAKIQAASTDRTTANFKLWSTSPAINKAVSSITTSSLGTVTTPAQDYYWTTRYAAGANPNPYPDNEPSPGGYDIGAYEYTYATASQAFAATMPTAFAAVNDNTDAANIFGITTVYPNPAINLVNVLFSSDKTQKVQVKMIDVNGKEVKSFNNQATKGNNKIVLDVKGVAPAMYLLIISNGLKQVTKTIITGNQ